MNRNLITIGLISGQAKIIAMYENGVDITEIAAEYNAKVNTICRRLRKWGIKIKDGDWYKKGKYQLRREFSPKLLAKMKENSRINNEKIQYIEFVKTTRDQELVHNIINHPIMTV